MEPSYATSEVLIRDCRRADLDVVHALHVDAALHTTALWQDEPNPRAWFNGWLTDKREHGLPVIVADVAGAVAGYASYGPFREHDGYRYTVEHSVYVLDAYRGRGIATTLMRALIERATGSGLHVMMAGITSSNDASIALHSKLGFETVGLLPEVGYKFGRWLDLTLMRLPLTAQPAA